MRKANFKKLKAGDLVQVPRYQFAPMRRGWNGWLFSEAVVMRKGISLKNGKGIITVEMRTPKSSNDYNTVERKFYEDTVFYTNAVETAKHFMEKDGVTDKESFYKFIERDDVTGCDWIRFLIEKGFLFNEEQQITKKRRAQCGKIKR